MTMAKLSEYKGKRCLTASGWLIYNDKVLFVKHALLGIWLSPGGHVEEHELPHLAAEREFFEETGIQVKVVSAHPEVVSAPETENLPLPFVYNVHWINPPGQAKPSPTTGKICEQHYVFGFFVEPVSNMADIKISDKGVEEVRWFSRKELADVQTTNTIRNEAYYAFDRHPSAKKNSTSSHRAMAARKSGKH